MRQRDVYKRQVDQGLSDDFYAEQLRTPNLEKICQEMNIKTLIRYHEGYDHSYYFVSSFIGEHIAYHANKLNMKMCIRDS